MTDVNRLITSMVPVDRYPSLQCAVESKLHSQYGASRDNFDLASTTVQAPSPIHVQPEDFSDNESDGGSPAPQSEGVDVTCATNRVADTEAVTPSPDMLSEYEDVQQVEDEPVVVPATEVVEDWVDLAEEVNRGIDDGSSWEVDV